MKLVTKKDEEIFRTAVFMSTMHNKEKAIRAALEAQHAHDTDNVQVAFLLGLFYQFSQKDDLVFNHHIVKRVFELYQQILEREPEQWLVRVFYVREMLRWLGILSEPEEIEKNLMALLEQQRSDEPQIYFIVTYIMLADLFFTQGKKDQALHYLKEGTQTIPRQAVTIMSDFFALELLGFLSRLKDSMELELVDELVKLGQVYFPHEKRLLALQSHSAES